MLNPLVNWKRLTSIIIVKYVHNSNHYVQEEQIVKKLKTTKKSTKTPAKKPTKKAVKEENSSEEEDESDEEVVGVDLYLNLYLLLSVKFVHNANHYV